MNQWYTSRGTASFRRCAKSPALMPAITEERPFHRKATSRDSRPRLAVNSHFYPFTHHFPNNTIPFSPTGATIEHNAQHLWAPTFYTDNRTFNSHPSARIPAHRDIAPPGNKRQQRLFTRAACCEINTHHSDHSQQVCD
jgi:hypothetical protein